MNDEEFRGGTRYVVGKAEKAIGDVVDSRNLQIDGIVDQVAGGALHTYGRAKSIAQDAIESAPVIADKARDRLDVAVRTAQDTGTVWMLGAAVAGYALAWFIHARHD